LTLSLVWLIGVDVFVVNNFISEDIHGVMSESILESLGHQVVVEPLVMKSFPVVDDHVFVKSFKHSTSFLSNGF
jgi:hypothetical protein